MGTEEERFHELYKKNYRLLYGIARNRGIPQDEAEDAVQEVFLSYYAHYPLTWPDLDVQMMLVRILRNFCIDYLRKKARRPVDSYDSETLEEVIALGTGQTGRDTLDIVMENSMFDDLLEGIKAMKPDMMTVFVMYVIQGRTMNEISRIVGVSEAACRMRLTRARRFLERYLTVNGVLGRNTGKKTFTGKPGLDGLSGER